MSKPLTTGSSAAEPRPSRIRREPPAPVVRKELNPIPTEREAWTVAIGVVLFGIAVTIITIGISEFLGS